MHTEAGVDAKEGVAAAKGVIAKAVSGRMT
jgi:hypothetical protein